MQPNHSEGQRALVVFNQQLLKKNDAWGCTNKQARKKGKKKKRVKELD